MTIFPSSSVEISCGGKRAQGESGESVIRVLSGQLSVHLYRITVGPTLLNDAGKLHLHWKSIGKSSEDIQGNGRKRSNVDREIPA
jgi:hypothetical protein